MKPVRGAVVERRTRMLEDGGNSPIGILLGLTDMLGVNFAWERDGAKGSKKFQRPGRGGM